MLTLPELVEILRQTQLVSPTHLNRLRRIAEVSPSEFTPKTALRWLIEQQQLTPRQAERLVLSHDPELAESLREMIAEEKPLTLADDPPPPAPAASRDLSTAPEGWTRVPGMPRAPSAPPAMPPTANTPEPTIELDPLSAGGTLDDLLGNPQLAATLNASTTAHSPGLAGPLASKRVRGAWDSPLMLTGGGALLLLMIIGAAVWFALDRQSGDELLKQANEEYRQGAYAQAIHKYDRFLDSFPKHQRASFARVQRGTARLRQSLDANRDGAASLRDAQSVLGELSRETAFAEARPELASLLPALAERLAKEAVANPDLAQITAAQTGYALATKPQFVPELLQPVVKLQQIEQLIRLAERAQQRDQKLGQALATIVAAGQRGDFAAGFAEQQQFVRSYPELAGDARLATAMTALSAELRGAVTFEPLDTPAENGASPSSVRHTLTFVHYPAREPTKSSTPGEVALIWIEGIVYAFDLGSETLLWQRDIGARGTLARVDATASADGIIVDSLGDALLRVDARSGDVRWRVKLAAPALAPPRVTGPQIVLPIGGKSLEVVDLVTGQLSGRWRLPQDVKHTPTLDPREQLLYVLGEHTNLFVLSLADHRCVEVVTLGHAAAMVSAPPVALGRYLFIAENRSLNGGRLHVLLADSTGRALKPLDSLSYRGQIVTPLAAQGRTLALVNELGAVTVYEVATGEATPPLKKLAELAGDTRPPRPRYLQFDGSQALVSGYQVTALDVQVARGRLAGSWSSTAPDPVVAPAQLVGRRAIFATRKVGEHTTIYLADPRERNQARPLATVAHALAGAVPVAGGQQLQIVTADGGVKRIALDEPVASGPAASGFVPLDMFDQLDGRLEGGLLALDDTRFLTLQTPAKPDQGHRLCLLKMQDKLPHLTVIRESVAGLPVLWNNSLLVPTLAGEIEWLGKDLQPVGEPFQPRLEPGVAYRWSRPIVLDDQSFVVSDRRARIYRVGRKQEPRPHLVALAERDVPEPIEALAVVGEQLFGRETNGQPASFRLPNLEPDPATHIAPADEHRFDSPGLGPWINARGVTVEAGAGGLQWLAPSGRRP